MFIMQIIISSDLCKVMPASFKIFPVNSGLVRCNVYQSQMAEHRHFPKDTVLTNILGMLALF